VRAPLFAEAAIEQTVTTIVRDTILGGVAIGGVLIAVWALRVMKRSLELRVLDAEAYASKLETSNEKDRARADQVLEMLRSVLTALGGMTKSTENQTRVSETQNRVIEGLTQAINGVLREAIGMRRASGSSDKHPAASPGRYGKKEEG
jgi:hypothetical protein